jgi:transposase
MHEGVAMLNMEDFLLIRDLNLQGLNINRIAQKTGFDRKTIRKYLSSWTPPPAPTESQQAE